MVAPKPALTVLRQRSGKVKTQLDKRLSIAIELQPGARSVVTVRLTAFHPELHPELQPVPQPGRPGQSPPWLSSVFEVTLPVLTQGGRTVIGRAFVDDGEVPFVSLKFLDPEFRGRADAALWRSFRLFVAQSYQALRDCACAHERPERQLA